MGTVCKKCVDDFVLSTCSGLSNTLLMQIFQEKRSLLGAIPVATQSKPIKSLLDVNFHRLFLEAIFHFPSVHFFNIFFG
jgi:hypothetical protein